MLQTQYGRNLPLIPCVLLNLSIKFLGFFTPDFVERDDLLFRQNLFDIEPHLAMRASAAVEFFRFGRIRLFGQFS